MSSRTRSAALLAIGAVLACTQSVDGQLRPLEPLPVRTFHAPGTALVELGAGYHTRQRASLAGTEGTLIELGNARGVWRTGRVAIEVGGTLVRLFEDDTSFAEPMPRVDPEAAPERRDVGDLRVATSVRLTPAAWPLAGFLRFGTRLPTTDNTVGIDRDRTDFFALIGGHLPRGSWAMGGEVGLGIHGSHHPRLEQSDVVLYAASVERTRGRVMPGIALLGHFDGMPGTALRGNEELAEIRAGARAGGRYWLDVRWVRGLTDFSPRSGFLLSAGWRP